MGPRTSLRPHLTAPALLGPSPLQGGYAMGTRFCVLDAQEALHHQPWILEGWHMEGLDGPSQPASPLVFVACSSLGPSLFTESGILVDDVWCQAHSCSSSHASQSPSMWQGCGPIAASTQQLCGMDVTWVQCSHTGASATGFDGWAAHECGSAPPCCPHLQIEPHLPGRT